MNLITLETNQGAVASETARRARKAL